MGGGQLPPSFFMIPRGVDIKNRIALQECYEKHGKYKIIATVRHTGTHSLKEQFPEYRHWHCNPLALEIIENNLDEIDLITTYRAPERTAASWFNRGQLPTHRMCSGTSEGCIFSWKEAWEYYGKILDMVPHIKIHKMDDLEYKLYTHPDKCSVHSMLDAGNTEAFYKVIDPELIKFAYSQIRRHLNDD